MLYSLVPSLGKAEEHLLEKRLEIVPHRATKGKRKGLVWSEGPLEGAGSGAVSCGGRRWSRGGSPLLCLLRNVLQRAARSERLSRIDCRFILFDLGEYCYGEVSFLFGWM